jgi:fructose/tagatose bisphosphate aldolase
MTNEDGTSMADTDDDGEELDLGISLEVVATVVDLAHAVQDSEEAEIGRPEDDEELDDDEENEITEEMLTDYIDELNEEQQNALIALAWVGRGDYEPEEWEEALKLAAERNARGEASTYLAGMEGLGDLLSEGLAAFGIAVEEVER